MVGMVHVAPSPLSSLLAADVYAAASGDTLAFERLVEKTKRVVTAMALGIVRDARASEDVAQEVYVQVWRDLRTLKNADSFLPWIRQLTRNRSLTFIRSSRRYQEATRRVGVGVAEHEASVLERAISEEEHLVLAEVIEALPDETREVLTLFYREDRSVRQVAELLGLSEDAVKKRLERGRAALRSEALNRFEELSRRTAPTAAFTAGVLSAVALGAPSTAAAATVAGTMAKTASGALFSALTGGLIGAAVAVFGFYFGLRRQIRTAIDERERRELIAYRNKEVFVTIAASWIVVGMGWLFVRLHVDRRVGVLVLVSTLIPFAGYILHRYWRELPAILERRDELERQRDPDAYATRKAREARGRIVGMLFGILFAVVGIGFGLYFGLAPQ